MLQTRPRRVIPVRRNQKGGDATSLPYEFYNPLAGSFPSNVPVATPVGGAFYPQRGGSIMSGNQVGGDATPMPYTYYNPIAANQCQGFFCGEPNNYIDYLYRGPRARNNARAFMDFEPFNPEGETLTGWQAPNAIPPYDDGSRNTVQQIRQRERSIVAPQGVVVKSGGNGVSAIGYDPRQVGGNCGQSAANLQKGGSCGLPMKQTQTGGGTFGAPFANDTFGCGPRNSPDSGLSYRFNECDLQTGVSFIPL